jgi:ATP-dependent Clp protease protease subunit
MIHQPWGGAEGSASDINIQAKEITRLREILHGILAEHSGQSLEKIAIDCDRDFFMSAKEAKEYGIVDQVFVRK